MRVKVSTDKLEVNSVLAAPVLNNARQVLIPSNVVIEEKHIKILRTWGIESVVIKADEGEEEPNVEVNVRDKAEELLYSRMTWKPRNKIEEDVVELGILGSIDTVINQAGSY